MANDGEHGFVDSYGQWALIAGGSNGLGVAFAHAAASRGLNCYLIARSSGLLAKVADEIAARWHVEVRHHALDLSDEGAAQALDKLTDGIDVGLAIVNAGGDTVGTAFLNSELDEWHALNRRNIDTLTGICHIFGQRMVAKGKGGIILVGSDAALGGAGLLSGYTATKAYALNLAESLWAELRPQGVAVNFLIIGSTDTPHMREVLNARGIPPENVDLADPADIAEKALERIADGPTIILSDPDDASPLRSERLRRERTLAVTQIMEQFYGRSAGE